MGEPSKPVQSAPAGRAGEKTITPAEFLQTFSLYRKSDFKGRWIFPVRLQWNCDQCGKETTWMELDGSTERASGHCQATYTCGLCSKTYLSFFVYNDSDKEQIYKVGQHPEPSIAIPKRLETGLKDSVQHYKKGLICFNQGYGIGAVAYFRRVVEERTNELIDVVAELAKANGSSGEEVKKILAAKAERTYDRKLEVASQMIPASLRPGGVNPLGRLHDLLSDALHVKDEEGALATAEDMQFIIEHVFSTLKDYIDAQLTYAVRIQKAGKVPTAEGS
jgi:hypothetical protein